MALKEYCDMCASEFADEDERRTLFALGDNHIKDRESRSRTLLTNKATVCLWGTVCIDCARILLDQVAAHGSFIESANHAALGTDDNPCRNKVEGEGDETP